MSAAIEDLERRLAVIVRAIDPDVIEVGVTEQDDDVGSLRIASVRTRQGRYHPDDDAHDAVARDPQVEALLIRLTRTGEGTCFIDVRPRGRP